MGAARTIAGTVALCALTSATVVRASDDQSRRTLAEALFRDARVLMTEKQYKLACPKLAESQRLDPGGGTLLNLALCHELSGRTATAWSEYRDALALARREKRPARVRFALEHISTLEPLLARALVNIDSENDVPKLVISVDGIRLPAVASGTAVPMDPGVHRLLAESPNHEPWSTEFELTVGSTVKLTVPKLKALPADAPVPTPVAEIDPSRASRPDAQADVSPDIPSRRFWAYSAGGIGLIGVGAGTFFGLRALDRNEQSESQCQPSCSTSGAELSRDAVKDATFADLGFAIGVVGIAVAAYLLITEESDETTSRAAPLPFEVVGTGSETAIHFRRQF